MLSPDDLAALEDTLDLLSDPKAPDEICRAREELVRGEFVGAEELRAKHLSQ